AALSLDDGLGHIATSQTTVTVSEWFAGTAVDPVEGANQLYPAVSGTVVVWQDDRNGHNDIYLKDLADLSGAATRLTTDEGSQERPAIDGDIVVWQDDRGGDFDIYGYDRATSKEFIVFEGSGDQQNPVVSGD
ncbi:MAG: hypothetical protein GWN07_03260, partial [Actinobacteria bacterium]|nr:hypothetical protein [Actinomycetota bacterium]NIU70978.1 hypothetical protein [Actinomycetota bacterium]NIW32922.1 hypothetical protein [Actinomycetota bacterium]NIX18902.1 hypothetical protein [Actinomycetota bacterium]